MLEPLSWPMELLHKIVAHSVFPLLQGPVVPPKNWRQNKNWVIIQEIKRKSIFGSYL